jgi:hypothetical protein
LTDTQFIGNRGRGGICGGGVNAWGPATVQGGLVQANGCLQDPCFVGGLNAMQTLAITGTRFSGNSAVAAAARYTVTIDGGRFDANERGVQASTVHVSGTQFVANSGAALDLSWPAIDPSAQNTIINALFAGNGRAIVVTQTRDIAIVHTTIASPTIAAVPAIEILTGTVWITNSIIASHTIGISLTSGAAWEAHNLFFGNSADTAGPVVRLGGSLTGDPRFMGPNGGDYQLGAHSAALDVGQDAGIAVDFEGDPRPTGAGFDLGFDEYTNLPPSLSALADVTVTAGVASAGPFTFTVADVENPAGSLVVSATSSNQALAPTGGIVLGGSGMTRTLTVALAPGQTGVTMITVTVEDEEHEVASVQFRLTVVADVRRLYLPLIRGP